MKNDNMKQDNTQRARVLQRLKITGKISQLQALRDFGCMRLAAVIHKLRRAGYDITTEWRKQKGKRYAVYYYQSPETD